MAPRQDSVSAAKPSSLASNNDTTGYNGNINGAPTELPALSDRVERTDQSPAGALHFGLVDPAEPQSPFGAPPDRPVQPEVGRARGQPVILITEPSGPQPGAGASSRGPVMAECVAGEPADRDGQVSQQPRWGPAWPRGRAECGSQVQLEEQVQAGQAEGRRAEQLERGGRPSGADQLAQQAREEAIEEEVDGIKYRIVAAVTRPAHRPPGQPHQAAEPLRRKAAGEPSKSHNPSAIQRRLSSVRRKSSALISGLAHSLGQQTERRRPSIYELTKSPPPETSLEIYLNERRRSSTLSSKQALQQQAEQQSTFEINYCQRQQYFKDLNQKLINQDKKLLNVVANRGQIHRHSVDIAQLPLHLARRLAGRQKATILPDETDEPSGLASQSASRDDSESRKKPSRALEAKQACHPQQPQHQQQQQQLQQQQQQQQQPKSQDAHQCDLARPLLQAINQLGARQQTLGAPELAPSKLLAIHEDTSLTDFDNANCSSQLKRSSVASSRHTTRSRSTIVIRKFQKLEPWQLSSTPAPDVKIGQRVAYKEYYGNEFGTIRWIGRVPQICPDWTVGVEFDNAIGEGDGSLNGRRYFIAKDCFAKFLPLSVVCLVDQHVGRPEPGTMISVMSAAVRPGQMISIQRVSTVHVQHCFLNAPHQIPGADILAVNTRLHCQCPNCGPCAHVIKPPRTQRLARSHKNATHMCQFSTYTCCGMQSQEEAICTYTGNKLSSIQLPESALKQPPIGNSWIEGAGYLSNLQAQQRKLMPEEYKLGAAPEDIGYPKLLKRLHASRSKRSSGKQGTSGADEDAQLLDSLGCDALSRCNNHDFVNTNDDRIVQKYLQEGTNQIVVEPLMQIEDLSRTKQLVENSENLNQRFELACPDKIAALVQDESNWLCQADMNQETIDSAFASAKTTDSMGDVDSVHKNAQKCAKVVYRDSIENRYLFPTDDLIDSTLEADLENLSQARYGHSNNDRLNGSRSIFKSLRSLVSCLSAPSNESDFEKHSENTLRFSDYGKKGHNSYKSVPGVTSDKYQGLNSQFSSTSEDGKYPNIQDCSAFSSTDEKSSKRTFCCNNNMEYGCERISARLSSSTDCGFSSASQNSCNFHLNSNSVLSTCEKRKRNQLYNHFLDQLIHHTSISEEELIRLKKSLHESNRQPGLCQEHCEISPPDVCETSLKTNQIGVQKEDTIGCQPALNSKKQKSGSVIDISCGINNDIGSNERVAIQYESGSINNYDDFHPPKKSQGTIIPPSKGALEESSTYGSVTLSSYDYSINENAHLTANQASHLINDAKTEEKFKNEAETPSSALSEALELKLILSINPDTVKAHSSEENYSLNSKDTNNDSSYLMGLNNNPMNDYSSYDDLPHSKCETKVSDHEKINNLILGQKDLAIRCEEYKNIVARLYLGENESKLNCANESYPIT